MKNKKFFQISTAIDYPSGSPHLGHMYEKVCVDVLARWKRLQGFNVHFSTGTDCHGLKLQRAAEKIGKSPEQYVKETSKIFKELCKVYNISYDDFIMTTEDRHEKTVISILKKLEKSGYVYKGDYEGLYCVDCETFYTEKDLVEGKCPFHQNKEIEKLKEETYFFKLSEFKDQLIKNIKGKDLVWPKKKENEIINRLEDSLKDLSISRANVSWGIPLPFDKSKTIAVWNDALVNYLSTVDYPNKKFKDFWPATHVIGSDIVWHHTAIWYSMLLGIGVKLPKVIVHGFVNMDGEKLSKSKGLKVDPLELAKIYPVDSIRYFLIRNFVLGQDGDFSEKLLVERHNNELANKLGNLVSRVSALAEKYGLKEKKSISLSAKKTQGIVEKYFENYEIDKALTEIFAYVDKANQYAQDKKPWEKGDKEAIYELAFAIKNIAILLSPFMPETSEKISKVFNFKLDYKEIDKPLKISKIKKADILFVKIDEPKAEAIQQNINKPVETKKIEGVMNMIEIKYDDFAKLDLRVGTIISAEDIKDTDKLLKLTVDLGKELGQRTICAGIKKYYPKEKLEDKQIIVIANLEPRVMRGVESKGMLLAAGSPQEDTCILISPDAKVTPGTKIN
jgi:methionyl-tRNA synthetase